MRKYKEKLMSQGILYTIGYQRKSFKEFLQCIIDNNISVLIDIRYNPDSRRRNFSKSFLETYLPKKNITYVHYKELGAPTSKRHEAKTTNNHNLVLQKWKRIIKNKIDILNGLKRQFDSDIICFMCYEKEVSQCHRLIVSDQFAVMHNYKVIHL